MAERQSHDESSFLTLTYSPECLPMGGTLVKPHFQDFMKRLRSRISPRKVRYFMCGEYGERFSRPHYHALLFGFDFPDREFFKEVNGERLFTSELLESLWPFGFSTIGNVTFESAAYVARYCVKKVNGEQSYHHYMRLQEETGELVEVEPEYATMSRRPGIGSEWFDRYGSDVFPSDEFIVRGVVTKPPRFFDERHKLLDEASHESVKRRRVKKARERASDNTPERLDARRRVKEKQLGMLKRGFESC
jgi:hypothetical protein